MRRIVFALIFFALFSLILPTTAAVNAQSVQIPATRVILQPDARDIARADEQGLKAFKILPRGMFDFEKNDLAIRGGGAYYSFVKNSHSYNEIPQIGYQDDVLLVCFAGADYGFIADLGETPLSEITVETAGVKFLSEYRPPLFEPEIRAEYRKIGKGLEADGIVFRISQPVVVGHTYVSRSLSFNRADTLVAFHVSRKNEDGSLIIFWKPIKDFERPKLLYQPDDELKKKVEAVIQTNGWKNVTVEVKDNIVTLNGTLPRGQMSELFKLLSVERAYGFRNMLREK